MLRRAADMSTTTFPGVEKQAFEPTSYANFAKSFLRSAKMAVRLRSTTSQVLPLLTGNPHSVIQHGFRVLRSERALDKSASLADGVVFPSGYQ